MALDIDVESIRRGAAELERAKEVVREHVEAFQTAVESFADAFGGDTIGMLVGVAHQSVIEGALECLTTNVTELEDYVDTLNDMADKHEEGEEKTRASFETILGAIGG